MYTLPELKAVAEGVVNTCTFPLTMMSIALATFVIVGFILIVYEEYKNIP